MDWRDHIEEAKILLGSSGGRPQARRLLEEVVSVAQGTPLATEALKLLERYSENLGPERRNPEIEGLQREWQSIVRPDDARLVGFLDRLRKHPAGLAEMQPQVVRILRGWLGYSDPDEPRLEALARLATAVAKIPTFEADLRGEILQFRCERFRRLLAEVTTEVGRALQQWDIDCAWTQIDRLGEPPDAESASSRGEVEQLVYEADALRTGAETALDRWSPQVPIQWTDLRVLLESVTEARQLLANSRVPQAWQDRIRRRSGELVASALYFLQEQASSALSIDRLVEFWSHYQQRRPAAVDPSLEAQPAWFAPLLNRLADETAEAALVAEGPGALESLAQRICADSNSLPPSVAAQIAEWAGKVRRIGESWRGLERGEDVSLGEDLTSVTPSFLPKRFTDEAPFYQAALARVRSALTTLERPGEIAKREELCEEALAVAREVLERTPGHNAARLLRDRAEQLRIHLVLDEALRRWDVEGFLISSRLGEADESYTKLALAAGVLRDLAHLAAEPELTTSQDGARWWRQWTNLSGHAAEAVPAAFAQALRTQEERRQGEWLMILDGLLRAHPSLEVCREVVATLDEEFGIPGLGVFRNELLLRVTIGEVENLIDDQHWAPAEERLKQLEGRTGDYRRLSCRLAVGRARVVGPVTLADVLIRSWTDVLATFGSEAYDLLESALAGVWKREDSAALRGLGEIVRRVARIADLSQEVRGRIEDWSRWLEIERAVEERVGASSLQQLALYVRENPSPLKDARLQSWIERWRRQDDTVPLAWAFQAFPELFSFGDVDPADEITEDSRAVADRILLDLHSRADLDLSHLGELRQQAETCERRWRDLYDYLSLVDHPVERSVLPEVFQQARSLLGSLLHAVEAVERLESADLRQRSAQSDWKSTRLTLVQDLQELPVAADLQARLERLDPLTRLDFLEARLRETATACEDPERLDDRELFAQLAAWVRDLIGRFERAGRMGGAMWKLVSAEYWQRFSPLAGDLVAHDPQADLHALALRFEEMEGEERSFREALLLLDAQEPSVSTDGPFFPNLHAAYLDLYPRTAPGSRRVFRLFDRFAKIGARPVILREGAGDLPAWIADYLHRGVP